MAARTAKPKAVWQIARIASNAMRQAKAGRYAPLERSQAPPDRPDNVATDIRYNIAVHESGHALVGLSYGLQIRGMHIDPDHKSSGTKFLRDDFDHLMLDDQVVVAPPWKTMRWFAPRC